MIVEIYGIPEDLFKCPGCMQAIELCKRNALEYRFIPIIAPSDNQMGFEYIRDTISELKLRANKQTAPRQYPQIFVDGTWIGSYLTFKETFFNDSEND